MVGNTVKQRDPLIDIIKGVAILLVLVGHVIQFASGVEYQKTGAFYDNVLFKVIYSFHMPLFMVVSGFLFHHSVISKSPWTIIWNKVRTLIIPIFTFALIVWLIRFNSQYSFVDQIRSYLSMTRYTLWFLWALFYSSMGVLAGHYLFKNHVVVWVILILASFLTPDKWFSEMYKFTFPCFLFGYYARKYDWLGFLKNNIHLILPIGGLVFISSLFFYHTDCYVYMSGCDILSEGRIDWIQLGRNIFRILVGILGSVVCISLILFAFTRCIDGKLSAILAQIGMATMGIYCFQTYIFELYSRWFTHGIVNTDSWVGLQANRFLCFVLAFLVSYGLTWIVKRIKVLNIMFLGGR